MNKEELLKQLEEAKNQLAKLQSDIDKMQNTVDTIKDKDNNSLPEFWFPEKGKQYFFIDTSDLGYFCEPAATVGRDDTMDFLNVMLSNTFRTEEECEIEIELLRLFAEIKEKALQEDELVPKDKILDINTKKYLIKYDCEVHQVYNSCFSLIYTQGLIPNCYFKTPEFTEKIMEEYGERIKTVLNKKYGGNNVEI